MGSPPSSWASVFGRRKLIPVLNSEVWNSQHLLHGHFKKGLCQIWDRLTFHCGLGTFRKNYPPQLTQDRAVLRLPLGGFTVLAFSPHLLSWKTRNEFSLHPRWERGGGRGQGGCLCKLKFVTVGRTVALQPKPISGCTASQPHCKVLKILPPTPRIYIYMYIKKNPLSISQYTKGPHHTAKIAVPTLVN